MYVYICVYHIWYDIKSEGGWQRDSLVLKMEEMEGRMERLEILIVNISTSLHITENQLESLRKSTQIKINEENENLEIVEIVKK